MVLRAKLAAALFLEEEEMIEPISKFKKRVEDSDLSEEVKKQLIKQLNTLLTDTREHGKLITKELYPLARGE